MRADASSVMKEAIGLSIVRKIRGKKREEKKRSKNFSLKKI